MQLCVIKEIVYSYCLQEANTHTCLLNVTVFQILVRKYVMCVCCLELVWFSIVVISRACHGEHGTWQTWLTPRNATKMPNFGKTSTKMNEIKCLLILNLNFRDTPKSAIFRIFGLYSYQWLESFEIADPLGWWLHNDRSWHFMVTKLTGGHKWPDICSLNMRPVIQKSGSRTKIMTAVCVNMTHVQSNSGHG